MYYIQNQFFPTPAIWFSDFIREVCRGIRPSSCNSTAQHTLPRCTCSCWWGVPAESHSVLDTWQRDETSQWRQLHCSWRQSSCMVTAHFMAYIIQGANNHCYGWEWSLQFFTMKQHHIHMLVFTCVFLAKVSHSTMTAKCSSASTPPTKFLLQGSHRLSVLDASFWI